MKKKKNHNFSRQIKVVNNRTVQNQNMLQLQVDNFDLTRKIVNFLWQNKIVKNVKKDMYKLKIAISKLVKPSAF